jgi:hypothetical protein
MFDVYQVHPAQYNWRPPDWEPPWLLPSPSLLPEPWPLLRWLLPPSDCVSSGGGCRPPAQQMRQELQVPGYDARQGVGSLVSQSSQPRTHIPVAKVCCIFKATFREVAAHGTSLTGLGGMWRSLCPMQ